MVDNLPFRKLQRPLEPASPITSERWVLASALRLLVLSEQDSLFCCLLAGFEFVGGPAEVFVLGLVVDYSKFGPSLKSDVFPNYSLVYPFVSSIFF